MPKHRMKALSMKLLTVLTGTIVAFLLLELFVLIVYGEQAKFPRHVVEAPWGLRYNDPGSRYRHKSADVNVHFAINNQGMRAARDYSYEKPEDLVRIISLGDSFTIGYEVQADKCFSSILEKELKSAGVNVEVLNAGVSGFSNAEAYLYLERELLKYDPNLVIVSFFANDLVDNVRTDLFKLENNTLVLWHDRYIPAGRLGNFLNTNWFFNLLSERSNAFVLIKERLTSARKRQMVRLNEENPKTTEKRTRNGAPPNIVVQPDDSDYQARLAAAILNRMYCMLRQTGRHLIIHSIPIWLNDPNGTLIDTVPLQYFEIKRPGLTYLSSKELLEPYVGNKKLYWSRSHMHWTPLSHEIAGKALAKMILEGDLLN